MDIFSRLQVLDWNPGVWKLIVRLLLAALAGFLLGLERSSRAKDAGVRTQTMICVTGALLTIISKYAFYEMLGIEGVEHDVSRVASTIITGLSFLGAGMLLFKRTSVKGLTTASCICMNVAIGMAFGSGMLVIGGVATIIALAIQLLLHTKFKIFKSKKEIEIRVQFEISDGYIEEFKQKYNVEHFVQFKTTRSEDKMIANVAFYKYNKITSEELFSSMSKDPNILSFEKEEEN